MIKKCFENHRLSFKLFLFSFRKHLGVRVFLKSLLVRLAFCRELFLVLSQAYLLNGINMVYRCHRSIHSPMSVVQFFSRSFKMFQYFSYLTLKLVIPLNLSTTEWTFRKLAYLNLGSSFKPNSFHTFSHVPKQHSSLVLSVKNRLAQIALALTMVNSGSPIAYSKCPKLPSQDQKRCPPKLSRFSTRCVGL